MDEFDELVARLLALAGSWEAEAERGSLTPGNECPEYGYCADDLRAELDKAMKDREGEGA